MSDTLTTMLAVICTDPRLNIIRVLYHPPTINSDSLNVIINCQGKEGTLIESIPRNMVKYVLVLDESYDSQNSNINLSFNPREPKPKVWAESVHSAESNGYEISLRKAKDDEVSKSTVAASDFTGKLISADCTETIVENGYCLGYLKEQQSYVIINLSTVKLVLSKKE